VNILLLASLIGTLILALGVRLTAQSRNKSKSQIVTLEDYNQAQETLDSVFIETTAINRIFSIEDADFIARSATPDVQRLFFKERKKLALQWLRNTQRQVARLMDLHLRLASQTHDPSPGLELTLTARYVSFMLVSNVAWFLLWSLGIATANHLFSYTIRNAGSFCNNFRVRIERVNRDALRPSHESLVH
jgi:hypothetical protein